MLWVNWACWHLASLIDRVKDVESSAETDACWSCWLKSPVVLIVLRGYPGYQCPFCNRQARDFAEKAQEFNRLGAKVIMVYPGPSRDLGSRATEFLSDKSFPDTFDMLLDPGYEFTVLYGLRWDAPNETAYPSTFLIDKQGVIFFSKIVKEHGGRTTAAEILDLLPKPHAGR